MVARRLADGGRTDDPGDFAAGSRRRRPSASSARLPALRRLPPSAVTLLRLRTLLRPRCTASAMRRSAELHLRGAGRRNRAGDWRRTNVDRRHPVRRVAERVPITSLGIEYGRTVGGGAMGLLSCAQRIVRWVSREHGSEPRRNCSNAGSCRCSSPTTHTRDAATVLLAGTRARPRGQRSVLRRRWSASCRHRASPTRSCAPWTVPTSRRVAMLHKRVTAQQARSLLVTLRRTEVAVVLLVHVMRRCQRDQHRVDPPEGATASPASIRGIGLAVQTFALDDRRRSVRRRRSPC